ncbi:MAG: DnaJ domain-containing protein [Propylenella sp.]
MTIIVSLLVAALVLALVVRHFLKTPAAQLAQQLRMAGGAALLAAGVGLLFLRQFALALPVGFAGLMILRRHAALRTAGPSGQRSSVRSAGLEMSLDHDSGDMDGRVLAGRYEGRRLSELGLNELLEVGDDIRGDAESLRLLESYLDRTHTGWRDDVHADETRRKSAPPGAGGMSTKEAYKILGLEPGASAAEVRDAHRRLMKQVHPDRGGSAALAAQINEAKNRILGEHR